MSVIRAIDRISVHSRTISNFRSFTNQPTDNPPLKSKDFYEGLVLQPIDYIKGLPGKGIRITLMKAINGWLQLSNKDFDMVFEMVDNLHVTSLVMDDIEDNSTVRRGKPAAHVVHGIPKTANAAGYLYFKILSEMIENNTDSKSLLKLVKNYADLIRDAHLGQGVDMYFREDGICPTEEEYRQIIVKNTSCLLQLAIKSMECLSPKEAAKITDFSRLTDLFGLHYRIRDDYANLLSPVFNSVKGFADDITEGKFSFPVIHFVHRHPGDSRILDILKRRPGSSPQDTKLKKEFIGILQEAGSLEYTKKACEQLEEELFQEIDAIDHQLGREGGDSMRKLLERFAVKYVGSNKEPGFNMKGSQTVIQPKQESGFNVKGSQTVIQPNPPCQWAIARNFHSDSSISNKLTSPLTLGSEAMRKVMGSFSIKNVGSNQESDDHMEGKQQTIIPDLSEINESIKKRLTAPDISGMSAREILTMPLNYATNNATINAGKIMGYPFQLWMNVPDDKADLVNDLTFMAWEGIVLLDDICDNQPLRRGKPSAYHIYGKELTLASSDLVRLEGIEYINSEFPDHLKVPAIQAYTEGCIGAVLGLGLENLHRDHSICPSLDEYLNMVIVVKTSVVVMTYTKLIMLFADEKIQSVGEDFIRFSDLFGRWAQLRDDYGNLMSPKFKAQRTFATDITEGKFTIPIVHFVHNNPNDTRILDILRMKTTNNSLKREVIRILEESGSMAFVENKMKEYEDQLHRMIDAIDDKLGDKRRRGGVVKKLIQSFSYETINTEQEREDSSWGL